MTGDDSKHEPPDEQQGRLSETFRDFGDFVARCAPYLSEEGMFLLTETPPSVGTRLLFRLQLEDGVTLVRGQGEVVWERHQEPVGVGIRFLDLDPLSRELVDRIRSRSGLPELVLGDGPEAVSRWPVPTAPTTPPPVETATAEGRETVAELPLLAPELVEPEPLLPPLDTSAEPAIFASPEPGPPPPAVIEMSHDEDWLDDPGPPPRRSWGLSPAALLLVTLAGITGGATYFLLESIAARVAGTTAEANALEHDIVDIPPVGIAPSRRPELRQEVTTPEANGSQTGTAEGSPDRLPSSSVPPGSPPPHTGSGSAAGIGPPAADAWSSPAGDPSGPLTRVRLVTWKEEAEGTVVTLWGDGLLRRSDLASYRIGGENPRELIKLTGVDWPLRDPVLAVGSAELRQIRSGFHPKPDRNELHLVFDLTDPSIRLASIEIEALSTRLVFAK